MTISHSASAYCVCDAAVCVTIAFSILILCSTVHYDICTDPLGLFVYHERKVIVGQRNTVGGFNAFLVFGNSVVERSMQ